MSAAEQKEENGNELKGEEQDVECESEGEESGCEEGFDLEGELARCMEESMH